MCHLLVGKRKSYKEIQYLNKVAVFRKVKIICSNNDNNINKITKIDGLIQKYIEID